MKKEHGTQLFAMANGLDEQMEHDNNLQCRAETLQFYTDCTDMFLCVIYMHMYACIQHIDIGSLNTMEK